MTENNVTTTEKNTRRQDDIINILLAVIVSFVCCMALPFSTNNAVGIFTVAVCSAFAVRVSSRKILTVMALLALFSVFGLSNGLPIITIALAGSVGCGAFAWLISKTESPYLALIPAVAYAATTVATKHWFGSLVTLLFIAPAILLAQSYEKMNTRVSSLLRVTVGFLSFIVLGIVLSVVYFTGEFRVEIITDTLNSFRDSFVKVVSSAEVTLVNGETHKMMSESEAYNYVSQIISLIPAIIAVVCALLAYIAQKVQFSIFVYTEGEEEFNDLRKIFIMSPASAAIFILSFLVYTLTSASSSSAAAATVCANLYLMFMPGLALMGIKGFIGGKPGATRGGCGKGFISIMFIALLFFSPAAALVMAACFGAYSAIEGPVRKLMSKKKDK